jgi:hypothetical protein
MNIKLIIHLMPWEIDYALLTFSQLKKSKYHLPSDINVIIDSVLNLSSYTIDWNQSKLPKEFFIEKYNQLSVLLKDYTHNQKIYDGDKLYGHLDLQKECISSEIDYYVGVCPDIYFSEYALFYLIESAKQIKNKYFLITPQISKVGDADWDEITNSRYMNIPYSDYLKIDTFDIIYNSKISNENISLHPTQKPKFAGWFDLYSKSFYEELCPVQEEWNGYGPWDLYSLIILNNIKQYGVDFQQYLIQGETIWMYPSGPLVGENIDGFSKYYKDFLYLNKHKENQRQIFESKLNEYLNKTFTQLKLKNIIHK